MSTRSHIEVKDWEPKIYKHSDGYPSGVLPVLIPFIRRFYQERGDDKEYAIAQIIREFARAEDKRRKERYEQLKDSNNDFDQKLAKSYKQPRILGWGATNHYHIDVEYIYQVDLEEGKLKVYETKFKKFWDEPSLDNTKKIGTVLLDDNNKKWKNEFNID